MSRPREEMASPVAAAKVPTAGRGWEAEAPGRPEQVHAAGHKWNAPWGLGSPSW